MGIPITRPCSCLLARSFLYTLNKAWPGLTSAPRIPSSPLFQYVESNAYITASDADLRAHLKHVALRMGPQWGFQVVSDADLMTAWLSPISLVGKEIVDPDAASVSVEKATLVDLIEPPSVLVLRLGVKAARNSAMSEVFLETVYHRIHIGKPLWVVDQPTKKLDASHMCFCEEAIQQMMGWDRLDLSGTVAPSPTALPVTSQGSHAVAPQGNETRIVSLPPPREKKKKHFTNGDR